MNNQLYVSKVALEALGQNLKPSTYVFQEFSFDDIYRKLNSTYDDLSKGALLFPENYMQMEEHVNEDLTSRQDSPYTDQQFVYNNTASINFVLVGDHYSFFCIPISFLRIDYDYFQHYSLGVLAHLRIVNSFSLEIKILVFFQKNIYYIKKKLYYTIDIQYSINFFTYKTHILH